MLRVLPRTNQTFLAPEQAELLQDRFERGCPFFRSLKPGWVMLCLFGFLLAVSVELWVMMQTTNTERSGIRWDPEVLFEKPRFLIFLLPGEFKRNLKHNGGMKKV